MPSEATARMLTADIAVITVIPDEYRAVIRSLGRAGCRVEPDRGLSGRNMCGWVAGELPAAGGGVYRVAVALAAQPGQPHMVNVCQATVERFDPEHVLLVGVAGGFPRDGLARGDVVLSSVISGYEYGKVADVFRPRPHGTHRVDPALHSAAVALHARDDSWATQVEDGLRPPGHPGTPKLLPGVVGSGDKIIDNADHTFFREVLDILPDLLAVEMEGAGAAAAVEWARATGRPVGFIMVRGISDMPRLGVEAGPAPSDGNKAERDVWKKYAAATAAAFAVHWIVHAWPARPWSPASPSGGQPSDPTPDSTPGFKRRPSLVRSGAEAADSSTWLGHRAGAADPAPRPDDALEVGTLKDRFARASAELLAWPTTLPGGQWLHRPELDGVVARVRRGEPTMTVVLGPPGGGKSAFLARLGHRLAADGVTVLAVKADLLPASVGTAVALAERLGLPAPADRAVLAAAAAGPVVVLLDQLDALADLADLRSERLHVLLDLVRGLADRPGMHVVCSCREFEYRLDGRLSRLDAEEVRLEPPAWAAVSAVLAGRGVAADGWPDDAKELLRVPYHLSVFLDRLRDGGEQRVFTTYQQLFDELWQGRVVRPGGGRAELLYDLAGHLSESEELWADKGRFEDRWGTAEGLIAAGVLALTGDEFRVGFRHQSLYEFVRAKAFARGGASLADHVLARQDGLFVRPTLWATLNYLRVASPGTYAREFDALWTRSDLRSHVKHLLVDFLAQVELPPPDDRERDRLAGALRDPAWRRKVLSAVAGRRAWFDFLARAHLPAEMGKPPEQAFDAVWVLVGAYPFDRDRCLRLVETHWLADEGSAGLAWHALGYLGSWDDRAVDLAVAVMRRTAVDQKRMWHVAQTAAGDAPVAAARIAAGWLAAAVARAGAVTDSRDERVEELRKVLDGRGEWYQIDELAARVPVEYARRFLPAVRDFVSLLGKRGTGFADRYSSEWLTFARVDRREYVAYDSPDSFFLALDAAVAGAARESPDEFLTLARAVGNPDSELLQRLVCRGMREVAASRPNAAFEHLLADPRRFYLGGRHDDQCDSVELVAALGTHLTDGQLEQLASAVRAWTVFRDTGDWDADGSRAQGHRFRLLDALPADRLPADIRRNLDADRATIPEGLRAARSTLGTGMREIVSPVSVAELTERMDAELAATFAEFPDSTGTRHPGDWMRGGSVQLSGAFEEFTKQHPDRALAVLPALRPGEHERPAAAAVRGLIGAGRAADEVVGVVESLDARGFAGDEFREGVAFALGNLARPAVLPDGACALLDRWRRADRPVRHAEDWGGMAEPENPSPVLWQVFGGVALPGGTFPVLDALTMGYLHREPHAADRWLDVLADHVERDESLSTWRAMCLTLENVRCCTDRDRTRAFVARLFERFPGVVGCQPGVRFVAEVAAALDDGGRRQAYATVRGHGGPRGPQAFGELVCLWHLWHPADAWAHAAVEAAFTDQAADRERVLVGVAYTAAELWGVPAYRVRATGLLGRLVGEPGTDVPRAAMTAFRTREDSPADDSTLALLRRVDEDPVVLARADVGEAFFEHLADAYAADPDLVCRVCEEAVARLRDDIRSHRTGLSLATGPVLDVALRLQRAGGDRRRRGMALFEALLDLGVGEAAAVARSNDLRLTAGEYVPRLPRRRRRTAARQDSASEA